MGKLVTDPEQMRRVLDLSEGMSAAEPAYILLAAYGHPDAHEASRKLTLEAQATGKPFAEVFLASGELQPYIAQFTQKQKDLVRHVESYTGIASEKTEHICRVWRQRLGGG